MVEVLTIGYGGKKPHAFFDELTKLNADLVVDVRRNPRRAFLGVYTIGSLLRRVDNYVWIGELGNALKVLPPRLVDEERGLRKLLGSIKAYDCKRVVLLCAEADEDRCHRRYVKEKLLEKLRKGEINKAVAKSWIGSFEAESDEELVIKQIVHNCNYWSSHICKRETLEKYCKEKGVENPTSIIDDLIRRGIAYTPRKGYVGLTEPEKHGLPPIKRRKT